MVPKVETLGSTGILPNEPTPIRKAFITKTGTLNNTIQGLDTMLSKISPIVNGVVTIIDNEKETKAKMLDLEALRPKIDIFEHP